MLDALTLDQMRTFVAVADSGSFRAAAGRLSRVQSAVSHAIGNLESHLKIALFDRSGHRPTLTPEGRALLADVRAILAKVDSMRARALGFGEGVELGLAIALDPQFPLGLAAAALKDLHDAYPSVSVQLLTAPLGASIAALDQGRAPWRSPQLNSRTPASSWKRCHSCRVQRWSPRPTLLPRVPGAGGLSRRPNWRITSRSSCLTHLR